MPHSDCSMHFSWTGESSLPSRCEMNMFITSACNETGILDRLSVNKARSTGDPLYASLIHCTFRY